jgi:hypothetical protein
MQKLYGQKQKAEARKFLTSAFIYFLTRKWILANSNRINLVVA